MGLPISQWAIARRKLNSLVRRKTQKRVFGVQKRVRAATTNFVQNSYENRRFVNELLRIAKIQAKLGVTKPTLFGLMGLARTKKLLPNVKYPDGIKATPVDQEFVLGEFDERLLVRDPRFESEFGKKNPVPLDVAGEIERTVELSRMKKIRSIYKQKIIQSVRDKIKQFGISKFRTLPLEQRSHLVLGLLEKEIEMSERK
jgi:hypothetical protein